MSSIHVGSQCPPITGLQFVRTFPKDVTPDLAPSSAEKRLPMVVEFWADWCGPCVQTIPHLAETQARFAGRLLVVGVTSDTNEGKTKRFADEHNMAYNVAMDTKSVARSSLFVPSGARGIPTAFVVDAGGVIRFIGHPMDPQFENAVLQVVSDYDSILRQRVQTFTKADLDTKSVKELKALLATVGKSDAGCLYKEDLIERLLSK